MLHPCNRRESFIRAHTKPPQSCEERKPAPPNEEQFNAPTTGGHAMNPIAVVLTSIGNSTLAYLLSDTRENYMPKLKNPSTFYVEPKIPDNQHRRI